jgi:nucleotide-binding universal stress UspA family protein
MSTIIATDGSELAMRALAAGLDLAKATGDHVVIATAWQIPVGDFGLPYASMGTTDLIDAERNVAEEALTRAADEARKVGVDAETVLLEGAAVSEICRLAKDRNARMIVLGTHGWGALKSALYGSVASGVMRHASCPVLVVPAGDDDAESNSEG